MAKFSAEMIRFLKSEEELTWKVPANFKKTVLENLDVTVHYHPQLVRTEPQENSADADNIDSCLIATFYKNISVSGKLFMRQPSIFLAAPSSPKVYRLHSRKYLITRHGFWYQSLDEGQVALRRAREMLKAKCIPDCQTGDFDSLFCVAYVEAEGNRGWIRYRPLEESWKTLTFDDDASMANTDLTGDVPAASRPRTDVEATTSVPRSRKRPAPRDQEASTSGASAGVQPVTGDQEARVPSTYHKTSPDLPPKRIKKSNKMNQSKK